MGSHWKNPHCTSLASAKAIMGRNLIEPRELSHFGINPGDGRLEHLETLPCSEQFLRGRKDGFVLVPGYPLTLGDIILRVPECIFAPACCPEKLGCKRKLPWFACAPFAKSRLRLRWHVLDKRKIELSKGPYLNNPHAAELAYSVMLYYLCTGIKLFEDGYVKCREKDWLEGDLFIRWAPFGFGIFTDEFRRRDEKILTLQSNLEAV